MVDVQLDQPRDGKPTAGVTSYVALWNVDVRVSDDDDPVKSIATWFVSFLYCDLGYDSDVSNNFPTVHDLVESVVNLTA